MVSKHKNTIIYLQIFRKQFFYMLQPVILLMCVLCQNVGFVLFCVIPPTAILPNNISTPKVARWWKIQRITAMEAGKRSGSDIADST